MENMYIPTEIKRELVRLGMHNDRKGKIVGIIGGRQVAINLIDRPLLTILFSYLFILYISIFVQLNNLQKLKNLMQTKNKKIFHKGREHKKTILSYIKGSFFLSTENDFLFLFFSNCFFIVYNWKRVTNSMPYATQSFNAAFTRALQ